MLLGALGALTCLLDDMDPDRARQEASEASQQNVVLIADGLAVWSGLASCLYLTLAERLRRTIEPSAFYFGALAQFTAYSFVASFVIDDAPPELLSRDPTRGLFGWAVIR